jgi:hypothetical protein
VLHRVICAFAGWILAVSGTFLFVLAISAGATMVYYSGICASLPRLRELHPQANAFRIPFALRNAGTLPPLWVFVCGHRRLTDISKSGLRQSIRASIVVEMCSRVPILNLLWNSASASSVSERWIWTVSKRRSRSMPSVPIVWISAKSPSLYRTSPRTSFRVVTANLEVLIVFSFKCLIDRSASDFCYRNSVFPVEIHS